MMRLSRRQMIRLTALGLAGAAGVVALAACGAGAGGQAGAGAAKLRFGVGPLQPTPEESKKAYEPFFKYLAEQLGVQYDLVATTDWAGISVALANDQVDLAWMGPRGYVLAHDSSGAQAIATVKYDGKPIYHAIIVGRPGLNVKKWPDGAQRLKSSPAGVGSASRWLIPATWFQARGIDPKTYFLSAEGATHAANEIAVANGQADLATD